MSIRKGSILLLLLLSCTLLLRADTVNFNDVANGTVVNTRYAGVTFINPLGGTDIYARNNFNPADTTNGVSLFSTAASSTGAFNAQYGAVDATFDTASTFVSIDVAGFMNSGDLLGNSPLLPFMEVYSGNTLLGKVFYSNALSSGEVGAYETLSFFSAAGNITRVRLSAQYAVGQQQVFAEFDNLVFDNRATATDAATGAVNALRITGGNGDGGGGSTSVPEPASLSLLGAGLIGLRTAIKRRK